MRTVIYSQDFEPITVVELPCTPEQVLQLLGRTIVLPVPEPLDLTPPTGPVGLQRRRLVTLRMEELRWKDGSTKWVFLADCDVNALALEPSWLPGQQAAVNRYERERHVLVDMLLLALSDHNRK